ncbi:MAG: hypothetical protein FJ088_16765, partial [Deltaproteobacteria bacterium]|nr:hypothetical protein [Deltaproteobacteria bacterium]
METEFERNFREAGGTLYEAGAAADVLRIVNEIITGFGIRSTGVSRKILERFPVLKNASTGISSGEITDVGSGVPQLG